MNVEPVWPALRYWSPAGAFAGIIAQFSAPRAPCSTPSELISMAPSMGRGHRDVGTGRGPCSGPLILRNAGIESHFTPEILVEDEIDHAGDGVGTIPPTRRRSPRHGSSALRQVLTSMPPFWPRLQAMPSSSTRVRCGPKLRRLRKSPLGCRRRCQVTRDELF